MDLSVPICFSLLFQSNFFYYQAIVPALKDTKHYKRSVTIVHGHCYRSIKTDWFDPSSIKPFPPIAHSTGT